MLIILSFLSTLWAFDIVSLTPDQEVKTIQEVIVHFSEEMVADNNSEAPFPLITNCSYSYTHRWQNSRSVILRFNDELKGGAHCQFQLQKDFKSLKGNNSKKTHIIKIATTPPEIIQTYPYENSEIKEDQSFVVELSGQLSITEIQKSLYFEIEGLPQKVEGQIKSGLDAQKIYRNNFWVPEEKWNKIKNNIYLVIPKLRFPFDKSVKLHWINQKNIKSVYGFKVRAPFHAKITCEKNNEGQCLPLGSVYLHLSSLISKKDAAKIVIKKENGDVIKTDQEFYDDGVNYISIPEPYKPHDKIIINLPKDLKDIDQRSLSSPSTIEIVFSNLPPLLKFEANFGILESENAAIPLFVRNIEDKFKVKSFPVYLSEKKLRNPKDIVKAFYKRKSFYTITKENEKSLSKQKSYNKLEKKEINVFSENKINESYVVGIPLKEKGFHVVEIESKKLGEYYQKDKKPLFIQSSALVTDLSVHLKWGEDNGFIWVTNSSKAEVVSSAEVKVVNCNGDEIFEADTNKDGVLIIENPQYRKIKDKIKNTKCKNKHYFANGFFVFAKHHDDLSFVHSSWKEGIESWRYNLDQNYINQYPYIVHSLTDRPLYRPDETVKIRHFIRGTGVKGLALVKEKKEFSQIKVVHEGSGEEFKTGIEWKKINGYSEIHLSENLKNGEYQIYLIKNPGKHQTEYLSGGFRVEEFKLPITTGKIIQKDEMTALLKIDYFNGGPYAKQEVKTRYWFEENYDDQLIEYKNVHFNNGEKLVGYSSATYKTEANSSTLKTNALGETTFSINLPKRNKSFKVLTEVDYQDPSGEIKTVAKSWRHFPGAYYLGIKDILFIEEKNTAEIELKTLNRNKQPISLNGVKIKLYQEVYSTVRKKLVGGIYDYESQYSKQLVKDLGEFSSDENGNIKTEIKDLEAGSYFIEAVYQDVIAHMSFYSSGAYIPVTEVSDRMDLILKNKFLKPNQDLEVMIQNNFQKSLSLITIEREGVIDYLIKNFDVANPSFKHKITDQLAPNAYLSVLSLSPRINAHKPGFDVDLGKPSIKMGLVQFKVSSKKFHINGSVTTDKQSYKPKEEVIAKINLKNKKDAEAVVMVIDEALLSLVKHHSTKLFEKMYNYRDHNVQTSSSQMMIVGKRHFGLKSIPVGGGGGSHARDNFVPLVYYNPDLKIKNGQAQFKFKLNDSLSKFKIFVILTQGHNKFSTIETSFDSKLDIETFIARPLKVREGDSYLVNVYLKNNTELDQQIKLQFLQNQLSPQEKTVKLLKLSSGLVSFPLKTPDISRNFNKVKVFMNEALIDEIAYEQEMSTEELELSQSLLQFSQDFKIQIAPLSKNNPGKLKLNFIGNLFSDQLIKEKMMNFPYSCLEQKISKAIVTENKKSFNKISFDLKNYIDQLGFLKFFPDNDKGSDLLTSWLIILTEKTGYRFSQDDKLKLVKALKGFVLDEIKVKDTINESQINLKNRKLLAKWALKILGHDLDFKLPEIQDNQLSKILKLNLKFGEDKELNQLANDLRANFVTDGNSTILKTEDEFGLFVSPLAQSFLTVLSFMEQDRYSNDWRSMSLGILSQLKNNKNSLDYSLFKIFLNAYLERFPSKSLTGNAQVNYFGSEKIIEWDNTNFHSFTMPMFSENAVLEFKANDMAPLTIIDFFEKLPMDKIINHGVLVTKETQKVFGTVSGFNVSDVLKIKLKFKVETFQKMMVIRDPIPAGAQIIKPAMGVTSSAFVLNGDIPNFVENKSDKYIAYFVDVYPGEYSVEYLMRLENVGQFHLPATRVFSLYNQDVFGATGNQLMEIKN
jgi:uncharacterized protein YfaS (alpha-2-macroglobulin family)